jgi:hypothetical protein
LANASPACDPGGALETDDLYAELMLIDENLRGNDLTPAERASAQARREAIHQQLHLETKAGISHGEGKRRLVSGGQLGHEIEAPRCDEAAAEATGQSKGTVRRDVTRGKH